MIFILFLRLDGPRLWSAIGLNKVDAVYFSHMHRPERVVSCKIAMIRSPDLSGNDGRYSRIAEFFGRANPGFQAEERHLRAIKSGRSRAGIGPESCRCLGERLA